MGSAHRSHPLVGSSCWKRRNSPSRDQSVGIFRLSDFSNSRSGADPSMDSRTDPSWPPVGCERDPVTVRRPDWNPVVARMRGQSRGDAAGHPPATCRRRHSRDPAVEGMSLPSGDRRGKLPAGESRVSRTLPVRSNKSDRGSLVTTRYANVSRPNREHASVPCDTYRFRDRRWFATEFQASGQRAAP